MTEPHDTPSPTPTAAHGNRSVWRNFADVVLEPSATFEDVAERPRWVVPLVVIVVASLIVSIFLSPVQLEIQKLQAMERFSGEALEATLRQIERFGRFAPLISVIGTPLFLAIFAFLFWGFGLVSGAKNSEFAVAFASMVYLGTIQVLLQVAQIVVVQIKGVETVAREGLPLFGLSMFVERGDLPLFAWTFIVGINFFSIWYAIVLGIAGIHALEMSRGAAATFAVILWLLGSLLIAVQG